MKPTTPLTNKTILVADDNEGIIDILTTYLTKEGFNPVTARDGEETILKFQQTNPVLILLDIMMPKKDGLQVCREIRKESNIPIIMITSKNTDTNMIMGLDTGADDYIVKPFSPGAVMARIRAILRRIDVSEEEKEKILSFPRLEINIHEYMVKLDSQLVNLTRKEVEIFWLLARSPGRVFTRENLLTSIWGDDYSGDTRTVDTHMKRLRAKLNLTDQFPWTIKTVWGLGYKFELVA
jgi:DNA-binding response OmpR family regulator